jgi:hypothetical protein
MVVILELSLLPFGAVSVTSKTSGGANDRQA